MVEVISLSGPVFVRITEDADFEHYGYYYEVYADGNCDRLLDFGNTYDRNESYDDALEWACNIAERSEYNI